MSKPRKNSDSVKRKINELSLEDNESSGASRPAGKKHISGEKIPEKMATSNPGPILAPAKFTPPTSNDLQEAIESVVSGDQADGNEATGAPNWASKVKKAKIDYPFALYVLAGSDERKNLTKPHYVEYERFLFNTIGKQVIEDNLKISIDFTIYQQSYGLVACCDESSSRWVKTQTKAFKYENLSTRAYNRWENEEAWIFSVFLSGEMFKQQSCKPNWITARILDVNKLKGDFTNAFLDKKSNKTGAYLSFEPTSKELIDQLNSRSRLNCILSNPLLHKRLRKQRTKEEFLELFNKKGSTEGDKPPI